MARGAKLAACFFPPLDPRCLGQNGYSHERDNHPGQRSRGEGAAAGEAPRKGGFRLEAPLPEARARGKTASGKRSASPPRRVPEERGQERFGDLAVLPTGKVVVPTRRPAQARRRPLALQTWEVHMEHPLVVGGFPEAQVYCSAGRHVRV